MRIVLGMDANTNTNTSSSGRGTMTYSEMAAARDGVARLWIDPELRFAKVMRDGATLVRIGRLTDGTVDCWAIDGTYNDRATVATWELASAWLTARATAIALTCELEVLAAA